MCVPVCFRPCCRAPDGSRRHREKPGSPKRASRRPQKAPADHGRLQKVLQRNMRLASRDCHTLGEVDILLSGISGWRVKIYEGARRQRENAALPLSKKNKKLVCVCGVGPKKNVDETFILKNEILKTGHGKKTTKNQHLMFEAFEYNYKGNTNNT
jgi:hypothetical protein